jgi:hypothetical protein
MTGYPEELQDFVESVAFGRQPMSGGPLARDVLAVVYGAYLSDRGGPARGDRPLSPLSHDGPGAGTS